MATAGRPRVLAGRLALLALGTLLPLALLEGVLRLAPSVLTELRGGARGDTTILCVGDSHTYGLHVLPAASYPSQLQAALDPTGVEVGVVNYGVPGRNSAALAAELPRYLADVQPDVVLLLVGFNDTWNLDRSEDASAAATPWVHRLRLWRLVRLIRLNAAGKGAERPVVVEKDGQMVVIDDGVERPAGRGGPTDLLDPARLVRQVGANLTRMVSQVREAGAKPVILTYATENQPVFLALNQNARAVASSLDVPLIAIDEPFRELVEREGYPALFFDDDHPNGTGNRHFAARVARGLRELGLVPERVAERPADERPPPELDARAVGGLLQFVVNGVPDRDVQVVLSPLTGSVEVEGRSVHLGPHAMIARCLESPNLRGRTDGGGRAALAIDRSFLGEDGEGTLYAVAVLFGLDGSASTSEVSEIGPR